MILKLEVSTQEGDNGAGLMHLVRSWIIAGEQQAISSEEGKHDGGNSNTQTETLQSRNIETTTPFNSLGWSHIESEMRQYAQTGHLTRRFKITSQSHYFEPSHHFNVLRHDSLKSAQTETHSPLSTSACLFCLFLGCGK